MSFYSPQSARKPPGRNKRMSVCAMATSPTYAFSPTAQKAQLEPLSQESRYIHQQIRKFDDHFEFDLNPLGSANK